MKRPNSQEMEDFEQSFDEIAEKMDLLKKRLRKEESSQVNNVNGSAVNETSTTPKTDVGSLAPTQFLPNSLFYTSSKEDQLAVNLITKNFDEFSNICSENGLNLVIQQEADNGVTVRLVQSSVTFSSRKAFKELDDLVKRKSERDEEMEVRFQKLIDNLEKFESKLNKQEGESSKNMETYKCLIDQQTGHIEKMTKKIINMSIDKFLEERNVRTIRETPALLEKVCKTLSEKLTANKDPPFEEIKTMEEKKKILREYLDFLQISAESTDIQLKISDFIFTNKINFVWKQSEEEKIKASKEMKEKFQLDNVVGTIHPFSLLYGSKHQDMYIAVVDKKIVDWVYEKKGVDVIYRMLHKNLKSGFSNCKFATQFKVEEKYSDIFVEVTNKDVFFENEKVIKWIKNNFVFLMNGGANTCYDHYVKPALYNLSLKHILSSQSSLVPRTN